MIKQQQEAEAAQTATDKQVKRKVNRGIKDAKDGKVFMGDDDVQVEEG